MKRKIYWFIKRRINWFLYLARKMKPYSVVRCFDDEGNYEYSTLCIYKRLTSKCDNFIRIRYNANECEIEGKIDKTMKDILDKDIAR